MKLVEALKAPSVRYATNPIVCHCVIQKWLCQKSSNMDADSINDDVMLLMLSWDDILLAEILPYLGIEDLFRLRASCRPCHQLVQIYFSRLKRLDLSSKRNFTSKAFQVGFLPEKSSVIFNNNVFYFLTCCCPKTDHDRRWVQLEASQPYGCQISYGRHTQTGIHAAQRLDHRRLVRLPSNNGFCSPVLGDSMQKPQTVGSSKLFFL